LSCTSTKTGEEKTTSEKEKIQKRAGEKREDTKAGEKREDTKAGEKREETKAGENREETVVWGAHVRTSVGFD
jgi:hypothetical protein